MTRTADVLVAGGGPAGAAAATLLRRRGFDVVLAHRPSARRRPIEVFAPSTLQLLRRCGLTPHATRWRFPTCRGVLSRWDSPAPGFFDYELWACEPAVMVDRHVYDRTLCDDAAAAGVEVYSTSTNTVVDRNGSGWNATVIRGSGRIDLSLKFIVDASGRHGGFTPNERRPVTFHDRLVALATYHQLQQRDPDLLVLEAAADGWWYAVRGCVVYLSDADLLPASRVMRVELLTREFARTRLLGEQVASAPDFAQHTVFDARSITSQNPVGERWISVGDRATARDPLSGTGTLFAVESACRAAEAVTTFMEHRQSGGLQAYAEWHAAETRVEQDRKRKTYSSVDPSFRGRPFWYRRIRCHAPVGVEGGTSCVLPSLSRCTKYIRHR